MAGRAPAAGRSLCERGTECRRDPVARAGSRIRPAAVCHAGRFLRARPAVEGRRRRVCRGGQGCAAQPRPEEAVRGGAAERRRTPGDRHGARRAHRGVGDASQRRARAVPVVAGAAAAGGSDWRGGDRPHPHRAEHQKPLGLLRALRSARRAPAVSERCRYAVDRPRPVPVVERFVIRARPSAAASRVRVSGARSVRQGDCGVRRSASSVPGGSGPSPAT